MVTDNVNEESAQVSTDTSATTDTVDTGPTAEVAPQQETTSEVTEPQAEQTATTGDTDTTPAPEAASSAPAPASGVPFGATDQQTPQAPVPQYSPEQITKMQQDAAQYAQVQQRAALQTQRDNYKSQLEAQGYLPEHADQYANYYMQTQEQQQKLMQQAEQYGQHLQGQQIAAESFVKKYNLSIDDLATLRSYNDPNSMENAAKNLAHNKQRDAELAQFKQARVPAQTLDNSQGSPEVAANEGSWLDRYNSGDRSPQAEAAAKRAAGLG